MGKHPLYGMTLRRRPTPEEKETEAKKSKLEQEAQEKALLQENMVISRLPFINFAGTLYYHIDLMDIALVCDSLFDKVKASPDLMVIGFDMEWPFNFTTGPGRTAVIQISPALHLCYILHVSNLKNLPKSLTEFLAHPNLRITGNNIKNDVRKLARDFVGCDVEKMVDNCVDLGVMANTLGPVKKRWSLEKLVLDFLKLRINKHKKVRNSEWHKIPLSRAQQKYAAIDAYASLLLYQTLKQKEIQTSKKEDH